MDSFNDGIAKRSVTTEALKWMVENATSVKNYVTYGPKKGDA
jgi:hypothetical protein